MTENIKKPRKTKKASKHAGPGKKFGRAVKDFLGGEMLKSGTFRLLPFLVFVTFLAFIYIASNYYAESKIRKINRLRKELKEIRYEYITTKSKLTELTKQSQMAKKLESTGIKESTDPVKTIVVKNMEEE